MIAPEIRGDIGELLDQLAGLGFRVVNARYSAEHFGNWVVDVAGPIGFRITRDRGQYMLEADRDSLERANLWRAFDDREEFAVKVLAWVTEASPQWLDSSDHPARPR